MGDRARRTNDLIPRILAAGGPDMGGLVVRPGKDGESFTVNGKSYEVREDLPVSMGNVGSHAHAWGDHFPQDHGTWTSSSTVSGMAHPIPEVALRSAIRTALKSGLSNEKIAEIFALEQISVVMES